MHHGREGWELVDYSWCERTGVATLLYERPATKEKATIMRAQPTGPTHTGWYIVWHHFKF